MIGVRDNHVLQQVTYRTRALPTEIQLSDDQLNLVTNDVPVVGELSVAIWVLCVDPFKVREWGSVHSFKRLWKTSLFKCAFNI